MLGIGTIITRRVPRVAFLPTDLATLESWHDANLSFITKDGSDNVSTWTDRSSNTHDIVQAVGASQPNWVDSRINGLPTVQFNGTSDHLKEAISGFLSSANTGSIFSVVRSNNTNSNENGITIADEATLEEFMLFLKGNTAGNDSIRIFNGIGGVTENVYGNTGLDDGVAKLLTYESNGSAYTLRINGVDEVVNEGGVGHDSGNWFGDISDTDNFVFGALRRAAVTYYISEMAEVIIYNTQLSASDRGLVETYLNNKYSLF